MTALEQDLSLHVWVLDWEWIGRRFDRLIDTDPLKLLSVLQLCLVLLVFGLFLPKFMVGESHQALGGSDRIDWQPH